MNHQSFKIPILLFCLIGMIPFLYEELATDFSIENVSYPLPYDATKEIPSLSAEKKKWLHALLRQPFRWIGQGHQVHVFESADKKYVLKIFKFKRLKDPTTSSYLEYLPFINCYYELNNKRRDNRFKKLFNGYYIAYLNDQSFTRIHYVHLNHSKDLKEQILVFNRLGKRFVLDADSIIFAIQEKGTVTKEVLRNLLKLRDIDTAKKRIAALFEMYIAEYHLGIYDADFGILQNTGFIEDQPIRLDIGQLKKDEAIKNPVIYKKNIEKVALRIESWVQKYFPKDKEEIKLFIKNELSDRYTASSSKLDNKAELKAGY